jgi:hypothetical protein
MEHRLQASSPIVNAVATTAEPHALQRVGLLFATRSRNQRGDSEIVISGKDRDSPHLSS